MESDLVPNPSKNMHARLDQVRKAIKSQPSPDARRVSTNAYAKPIIQALQDYSLTIWEGCNTALQGKITKLN